MNVKNRKNTAATFSLIAMICSAICCVYRCFYYIISDVNYIGLFLQNILMYLPPFVLVFLYFTVLQKKNKASILLAISFGFIAARHIMDFLIKLGVFYVLDVFWYAVLLITPLMTFLLVKFKKKAYIVVAAVGIVTQLYGFIFELPYLVRWDAFGAILSSFYWDGIFALYFAILLYAMDNNILAYIRLHRRKHSPEQDLLLLQDKLEQGLISEEEYQAQRAEIISKL